MKNVNTDKEYVCVRVQIVRVKKGLFKRYDKILGFITVIPNTEKEAIKIFKETQRRFRKYGVSLND